MPPIDSVSVVRSPRSKALVPAALPLVLPARSARVTDEEAPATDLISFLRDHYPALLLSTLAGILLAYLYTGAQTPIFRAGAVLEIQDLNENFLNLGDVSQVSVKDHANLGSDLPTQLRLLQSRSLLERVLAELPAERVPPPTGLATLLARRNLPPPNLLARLEATEQRLQVHEAKLTRIVDLMRHLRGSETRRHVREEVPFYTGPRVEVAALVDSLP